ncbi:MAG: hypothetical protein FJ207_14530 [Gemmatimonadetes bacterium]|nr:hypothetical protein [Gemmatimonadota bacterium]
MNTRIRSGRVLSVALASMALGGCEFITAVDGNPNAVAKASVDQLFTGIQVNTWFFAEGQLSRITSMWTQQMTGVDRQFESLDNYQVTEADGDDDFGRVYTSGGLVDIRRAIALAEAAGRAPYAGILRIHEAYLVGMAASIWGAIPYREAVNLDIPEPVLDPQAQVYGDVQALLDKAITDLGGTGAGPGPVDLWFGGNTARWIAVARTLKARFFMHQAEASNASYALALAQANQGITAAAGTWKVQHSTAATENNLWYQFFRDRSGYIGGGDFLGPLMATSTAYGAPDPRVSRYFSQLGASYVFVTDIRSLLSSTGFGSSSYDFPIVTCAENQFIIAEATLGSGGTAAAARTAADAALDCEEAEHGLSSIALAAQQAANDALTGTVLRNEIMRQKYIALFLNIESYNDWKRTCQPAIRQRAGGVPGRLYYGLSERQTNPNIPAPSSQPPRNANDPAACP